MTAPLAGDYINASDITRARPKMYWDNSSGNLPASSSAVAIPGISISFTTETDNADVTFWWNTQAAGTGGTNTTNTVAARPRITAPGGGTTDAPVFSSWRDSAATDQATVGQTWSTTLGVAGTYTITLLGSTGTNQLIAIYTSLTVMVQEQFS